MLIQKDFKLVEGSVKWEFGLRVLLIQKDFKQGDGLFVVGFGLSLVNTEGFQTSAENPRRTLQFESLVNTEGFQTCMLSGTRR